MTARGEHGHECPTYDLSLANVVAERVAEQLAPGMILGTLPRWIGPSLRGTSPWLITPSYSHFATDAGPLELTLYGQILPSVGGLALWLDANGQHRIWTGELRTPSAPA